MKKLILILSLLCFVSIYWNVKQQRLIIEQVDEPDKSIYNNFKNEKVIAMKSKIQYLKGKWVDIKYQGKIYKKQQSGIIMETSENDFVFEASEVKPNVITYDNVINVEEIK